MSCIRHGLVSMTAKEAIVDVLGKTGQWMAIFEFQIYGKSENAIATRLNELERAGKLVSRYRKRKPFKEWHLVREAGVKITMSEIGQMEFA